VPLKPLLLTLGDPAGVGPEITVKAWKVLKTNPDFTFAIIAPPQVIEAIGAPVKIISSLTDAANIFPNSIPVLSLANITVTPGRPCSKNARIITASIEKAVSLCLKGKAAGMVTNPIAKDILYEAGFEFPGHTEYLGELTKHMAPPYERGPVMMLSGGGLRVGLATVHMPLKEAAATLNLETIIRNTHIIDGALRCDFGIKKPRISLAGLNPHAGEGGALGHEEIDIINPAAKILRDEGLNVSDAKSADTLFHEDARRSYDAVLAMYHDQGLIPVKTLDFHGGVNITLGLPIIRTSPDHGTAFDIAGQNKARPDSLIAAIKTAREVAENRTAYLKAQNVPKS